MAGPIPAQKAPHNFTVQEGKRCGWCSSDEPEKRPIVAAAACPTAAILRPLGQTAVFAPGQSRQQVGVAFYGLLSEVNATCERAGDALRLKLDVVVVGERGPAAGTAGAGGPFCFFARDGAAPTLPRKRVIACAPPATPAPARA